MVIKVDKDGVRIDSYIASVSEYSRSKAAELIDSNNVLVNEKGVKSSYKVKLGDLIEIPEKIEEVITLEPEEMDIDIVYEDEYLAIINKKSGMVVHPAAGNRSGTLANGLLYHFNKISNSKTIRPGIVHRLDKDTSGLMVVAKDDKTHELLADMIKHKKVERKYIALVWGVVMHDKGKVDAPIGRDFNNRQRYTVTDINSKDSVTNFAVIERFKDATLLELLLETGRTHQIRVHMNYIGHPIVNDPVYGNRKIIDTSFGQMLHSKSIRFVHPITKKELYFEESLPNEFTKIVDEFKNR